MPDENIPDGVMNAEIKAYVPEVADPTEAEKKLAEEAEKAKSELIAEIKSF